MNRTMILALAGATLIPLAGAAAGDFLFFNARSGDLHRPNLRLASQPTLLVPPPAPAAEELPPGAVPYGGYAPPILQPGPQPLEPIPGGAVPLFHRVKYEDRHNIHPCAVPIIVPVQDPCADRCRTCEPQCVYVEICVPPNCTPEIKYSRGGRKVKYDYGEYTVEIESKRGTVYVDYDD